MTKGYWVAAYRSISDPEAMGNYARLAGPAIERAGGRFLARGGVARTFEAGENERTVLIEFDSVESAMAAYESAPYQEAIKALGKAAVRDIRIVQGVG